MRRRTGARTKRPLLLRLSALWLLSQGAVDVWRSITLWQTRRLLVELGSTLSPFASMLLATGWTLCGASLVAAAVGLWLRREWARHTARAAIVAHYGLLQAYIWAFVRTGLLWERRWSSLVLALLATAITLATLTWSRSRRWMGLRRTNGPSTTT